MGQPWDQRHPSTWHAEIAFRQDEYSTVETMCRMVRVFYYKVIEKMTKLGLLPPSYDDAVSPSAQLPSFERPTVRRMTRGRGLSVITDLPIHSGGATWLSSASDVKSPVQNDDELPAYKSPKAASQRFAPNGPTPVDCAQLRADPSAGSPDEKGQCPDTPLTDFTTSPADGYPETLPDDYEDSSDDSFPDSPYDFTDPGDHYHKDTSVLPCYHVLDGECLAVSLMWSPRLHRLLFSSTPLGGRSQIMNDTGAREAKLWWKAVGRQMSEESNGFPDFDSDDACVDNAQAAGSKVQKGQKLIKYGEHRFDAKTGPSVLGSADEVEREKLAAYESKLLISVLLPGDCEEVFAHGSQ